MMRPRLNAIRHWLLAAAGSLMLTGCFTGVESTPRISAPDAKETASTPEDAVLQGVGREATRLWRPGKEFIVTDNRLPIALGTTVSEAPDLAGKTVWFVRFDGVRSLTGDSVTDVVFVTPSGKNLNFRVDRAPSSLRSSDSPLVVPFTIEASIVDEGRKRLQGNTYYLATRLWRDENDQIVGGRTYVPVVITAVEPGNESLPIKVYFKETSADGRSGILLLTPEANAKTPRTFAKQFTIADPRKRHSNISNENWKLITEGRIREGMTAEECRLALGAPKEIIRANTSSIIRQQWIYEDGRCPVFEDGIIVRTR